jgi:uncharacterized protein
LLQRTTSENTMKFHLATADGHSITRVETDAVYVNGQPIKESFLLFPESGAQRWVGLPTAANDAEAAWKAILEYAPALVIIGTGSKLKFPHPSLLRALIDARIGYEVMDTGAACRTYNVLLSEGRKVCAAIVL